MPTSELFFHILLVVSLQVAAFSAWAFYRHWRVYQNMKSRLVGFDAGPNTGGHFYLQAGTAPLVLIAGGIGITPMISMLNACLMKESSREVWLFYGLRNSREHAMKEHLEALAKAHPNFRLRVCYSRALPDDVLGDDYSYDGHIDIALLRQTLSLKPYQFYVCGPRAMMESLIPALDEWGVQEQNIHYEAFGPASLAKSEKSLT